MAAANKVFKTWRPGDWICPNPVCGEKVHRGKTECFFCKHPRLGGESEEVPEEEIITIDDDDDEVQVEEDLDDEPGVTYFDDKGNPMDKPPPIPSELEPPMLPLQSSSIPPPPRARRPMLGGGGPPMEGPSMGRPMIGGPMMGGPRKVFRNMGPGDWIFPMCGEKVRAGRRECFFCKAPQPHGHQQGAHFQQGPGYGRSGPYPPQRGFGRGPIAPRFAPPPPRGPMKRFRHLKPGDWICPCGEKNHEYKRACYGCSAPKPHDMPVISMVALDDGGPPPRGHRDHGGPGRNSFAPVKQFRNMKPGDWICECGEKVYANKHVCFKCGQPKPIGQSTIFEGVHPQEQHRPRPLNSFRATGGNALPLGPAPMHMPTNGEGYQGPRYGEGGDGGGMLRPGEWFCQHCMNKNRGFRDRCFSCNNKKTVQPKPIPSVDALEPVPAKKDYVLLPGQWVCPGCGEKNRQQRMVCFFCAIPKPEDIVEGIGPDAGPPQPRANTKVNTVHIDASSWECPGCANFNISYFQKCNFCQAPKPEEAKIGPNIDDFERTAGEPEKECPRCHNMNPPWRMVCIVCNKLITQPKVVG